MNSVESLDELVGLIRRDKIWNDVIFYMCISEKPVPVIDNKVIHDISLVLANNLITTNCLKYEVV